MKVCPSSLHMFCGLEHFVGVLQEYDILGPLLEAIQSLYQQNKSSKGVSCSVTKLLLLINLEQTGILDFCYPQICVGMSSKG